MIAEGRFEEAKELLQEAIDGFQMIIDGNQDTNPDNLGYQMARAAEHNKAVAEKILQEIRQASGLIPTYHIDREGNITVDRSNYGGIDLSQKRLNLETQGDGVDFNLPFDPNHLDQIPINGLTPVIFKIEPVPIENFPLILGLVEEPSKELSAIR